MRRSSILALLLCALAVFGGTSTGALTGGVSAAEGDPDDYCSFSPDYPFGWSFNDACRGHDECLIDLPDTALLPDRLNCDDTFLDLLLESPHVSLDGVCAESRFCSFLANLYYRVVRVVTLLSGGAIELPAAQSSGPSSG